MSPAEPTLVTIRREIDSIDDSIHDLIMRRTALVGKIRAAKTTGDAWRPGREAAVLRRLVARHQGQFPTLALVRMWREMMSAITRLQGPFSVAACVPEDHPGYWDLARNHFGVTVEVTVHRSARAAIAALRERQATMALLPAPEDARKDAWWADLASPNDPLLIAAKLPFMPLVRGRGDQLSALVVGRSPQEPTGDDHSFLLLESSEPLSRTRVTNALKVAGLAAVSLCAAGNQSLFLAETADFVAADDARLGRLEGMAVRVAGGYAVPLRAARK